MAIKAQKSLIKIATGAGAAKNITAITKAYPPVITSAAHGFVAGDRVAIAAVGGMTELNGNTYTVEYATTNTFALKGVDASAYGTYTSGGTATPVTFTQVMKVKNLDPGGGSASEIDETTLDSDAKEFSAGLVDYGSESGELVVDFADAGQNALRARFADGVQKDFQITYPGGTVKSFTGCVREYNGDKLAVDGILTATFTVRKTGVTTWS